jgi:uncharacterized protein YndB with AHSA1/START domain
MKFDVTSVIAAETRVVTSREHEGRPARVVLATREYDTGIDDLWDAVTNAERIPRWFLPISGELCLGGRYQFTGNAGGTITRCDSPSHLAVTWEFGAEVSWVTVKLTSVTKECTRLELEHVAHVGDDRWKEFGPGAVGVGWDLGFMGLGRHIESDIARDPAEAAAWFSSAEGKSFIRASSAAWCDAYIASGADEAAARQAAARTTAAYTGEPPADDS